jgi:hypothetical protein
MRIFVNGQQNGVLATNDVLFASDTAATTAKYRIVFQGRTELQRSSGVWIGAAFASAPVSVHVALLFAVPHPSGAQRLRQVRPRLSQPPAAQ